MDAPTSAPTTGETGGADDGVGPRRSGDETREALLRAAHDLLAADGPAALSVRRIAAAAGVSTMNVYSRFGGKDGVLEELFIDGFRRLGEAMVDYPSTEDPIESLNRCGMAYRRFATANPTYYSLMFDRAIPDYQPSERAMAVAFDSLGRVVERVQAAMDAGAIPASDPLQVAVGLWACEHGLVSLEMRSEDNGETFAWDQIAPATVSALVRGLATRPAD